MRPYKHFVMSAAIAAVVFVASPATSEARAWSAWSWSAAAFTRRTPFYSRLVRRLSVPDLSVRLRLFVGSPDASLRIEVKPKEAEVFVDGFYAGIVDDFDGTFQRLNVPPGRARDRVVARRLPDGAAEGLSHARQHLQGQVSDGASAPPARLRSRSRSRLSRRRGQRCSRSSSRWDADRRRVECRRRRRRSRRSRCPTIRAAVSRLSAAAARNGGLRHAGGEGAAWRRRDFDRRRSWRGPGGQDRLTVEVPEGSHTVEIRKSGYRTYVTQVDVRRGQTTPLNVSLRGDQQ